MRAETTQKGMTAQDIKALIERHLEKYEHEGKEYISKSNKWALAKNSGMINALDRLLYAIEVKE